MTPVYPFISGSKGQRSRSQHLCRSSDRTQYYSCCVRKPRWVFSAVMSHRTSHVPASACCWRLGFPRHGFLHSLWVPTSF